ncbi:efflux RND transporter periplasmic adaptor subunit [Aliiglaciecola sp. NS0011-25]|uniref:efflux RND transporter periplasmic adaptor subunit n=1 Tax=Aliiglaciecola sp. NS0011-25 TaxID=3127654 RepID=UPI00333F218B
MNSYKFYWCCLLLCFSVFPSTAKQVVNVVVDQVKPQQLTPIVTLTGSLKAQRHANLSVLTDGIVTHIYAETGEKVQQGEALLNLDSALVKAQLQANKAALAREQVAVDNAQRRFTEAQSLFDKKLFAQTELADRETALNSAKASLLEAQANQFYQQQLLNHHQLLAPFNGIIAERMVDVGEWVTRGQSVFELVSNEQLWLDLYMPQEHFNGVDVNSTVKVYLSSKPEKTFSATVVTKVPVVNTNNRSFLLRLALDNASDLQVGLSASADIPLVQSAQESVVIERDALLRHPDGGFSVFIEHDGVAHRQSVKIGARMNGKVEITQGLKAEQWVVTQGNELLQDGQSVNVVSRLGEK